MIRNAFIFLVLATVTLTACRKAPAGDKRTAAPAATTLSAAQASTSPATALAHPGQPPAPPPAKPVPQQLPDVVARVNGEDVKKEDFERMINTIEKRAGQPIPPDRRDEIMRGALDQLVVYTLLSQESKTADQGRGRRDRREVSSCAGSSRRRKRSTRRSRNAG